MFRYRRLHACALPEEIVNGSDPDNEIVCGTASVVVELLVRTAARNIQYVVAFDYREIDLVRLAPAIFQLVQRDVLVCSELGQQRLLIKNKSARAHVKS